MAVDKALWRTLRAEWETSPKMTAVDVAVRLGITSQAVSKVIKKEGWAKYVVADLDHINYSPRQLSEIAIRSLVRVCTQTQDHAAAARAAATLLDRTMGVVKAEQTTPMLPPDIPGQEKDWPEWLRARRLAYQEGAAPSDDAPAEPPQQLQEPQTAPEPPNPTRPPLQDLPEPPPRPALRAVASPPAFYDRPGVPAQGSYREVQRSE